MVDPGAALARGISGYGRVECLSGWDLLGAEARLGWGPGGGPRGSACVLRTPRGSSQKVGPTMANAKPMMTFSQRIDDLSARAERLLEDADRARQQALPGSAFFMDHNEVLCLPRENGDSRYPYGQDGFNVWVYASGYIHANEGLFSHFLRAAEGQEPNVAFFAGIPRSDGRYHAVPLLGCPRVVNEGSPPKVTRYSVLSSSAAYFVTRAEDFRFVVRVFVNAEREICFSLHARNGRDTTRTCFVSSYFNPFLRHQLHETSEDRWFKEVRTVPSDDAHASGFWVQVNEDKDRFSSVSHYGVVRHALAFEGGARLVSREQTTSRARYVGGSASSLHTPESLYRGTFGACGELTTFVENAVAGELLHLELAGGAATTLNTVFGHAHDQETAHAIEKRALGTERLDGELSRLEESDRLHHASLDVHVEGSVQPGFKPEVFNAFFEHLKRQVEFCSLIKGYVQLSPNSLIGVRDVFQALNGLMFWRPEATREKMLEALEYTNVDGRCFRQYSLPSSTGEMGRMDLRPFIDQGVWIVSAVLRYLKLSGDFDFLRVPAGYHEIVDESRSVVRRVEQKDDVLTHLFKILDYMLEQRDHDHTGCVRALYGDWNDALDGLGISEDGSADYGTGVSVMVTLQVYQNCCEMIEILEAFDPKAFQEKIGSLGLAAESIKAGLEKYAVVSNAAGEQRIVHGWGDKRSYLVGGYDDPDQKSRDGLTANAYWIIAGLHKSSPSLNPSILASFERLDSKYGFKTFEPPFAEDAPGVGRIRKLPAGTAENGASYIHATAFAILALFQVGESKKAWAQLEKILPFTALHENLSHSPFVMPNSYGFNPAKFIDGQNMNDWQTGSSNVVLRTFIRYVFGFEPEFEGLWIQPATNLPFKSFVFSAPFRGQTVKIHFESSDGGEGKRTFSVNGVARDGVQDPVMKLDKLWIPKAEFAQGPITVRVCQ